MRKKSSNSNYQIYDRERIIDDADSYSVARHIGMNIVTKGKYNFILCPGHNNNLGKSDQKFGSCVLTPKGYKCFACEKTVGLIDMTMEYTGCSYPDALATIGDANGGRENYIISKGTCEKPETLPLSNDDLALIGLATKSEEKSTCNIVLVSDVKPTLRKGQTLEKVLWFNDDNEPCVYYQVQEYQPNQSLLSLYRENREFYNSLVLNKAKDAMEHYFRLSLSFNDHFEITPLIEDDNDCTIIAIHSSLKNDYDNKYNRAREIYNTYLKYCPNEEFHDSVVDFDNAILKTVQGL